MTELPYTRSSCFLYLNKTVTGYEDASKQHHSRS